MNVEHRESSHAGTWIAGFLALLVAYPLSVGPVAWFLDHVMKLGRPSWFMTLYWPLVWLDANNTTFRAFIKWYEKFWGF